MGGEIWYNCTTNVVGGRLDVARERGKGKDFYNPCEAVWDGLIWKEKVQKERKGYRQCEGWLGGRNRPGRQPG